MEPLGPFTILHPGGERNAAAACAEVLADQKRLGSRNEGWDVLYKDGLLVWRVHATSAKAAVAKVRGQLIGMGRNPAGLKLEAIRVPLDELSLKLF